MLGRIFKAYDIRGIYPDLLNETMAWQIGFGTSKLLRAEARAAGDATPMMQNLIVGRDMRTSSPSLSRSLMDGVVREGGHVLDVGLVDTPFVYFAINHVDCAGGVMVTASHNPPKYNGFKISRRKAKPVGEVNGLAEIRKYAAMVDPQLAPAATGRIEPRDLWDAYAKHVRSFLRLDGAKLKVVVDASNAMAGTMVPRIFGNSKKNGKPPELKGLEIIELNFDNTSGVFAHEPNPLVPENLRQVREAVVREGADLGICFDGDADRCMVVDEKGAIVGCDLLTAAVARHSLTSERGAAVVYDLRSSRAVQEEISAAGGVPVRSRVGHVFMKSNLAEKRGLLGGELSGHFYFRDNFNADSGAIAMATVLSLLAQTGKPMSKLIKPLARYSQSGEINFRNDEADASIEELDERYSDVGEVDYLDGITVDCFERKGWWFNVRKSNTEPLLRLNAEARDEKTLGKLLDEITPILGQRVAH